MDVVLYFMRWEDKYWGLFLISLFLLFCLGSAKKEMLRLSVYGILSYLVFLCPLTYKVFEKLTKNGDEYYRVSYLWLSVFVLGLAVTTGFSFFKEDKKRKIIYIVSLLVLLVLCGDFAFFHMGKITFGKGLFVKAERECYELVLNDAKAKTDNEIYIWGPSDWMAKSRVYNPDIKPIYGKDIADHPDRYIPEYQMMYQGYASYEDENSLLINKDQQLEAIANTLHLFENVPVDYVVVIDPKSQGTEFDAVQIFTEQQYEYIGKSGNYMIFRLE